MMKQITKELEFHFNVDKYIGDSQNERDMAIYSEAIVLPNNVDYRNLLIQIKFGDSKNIPNKIKIYCFKPKTELEKSKLSKNKPCTFISFFKHNIQSVFQKQKSKFLEINPEVNFDGSAFGIEEAYLIERVGFDFDNNDLISDISFKYQIFMKE